MDNDEGNGKDLGESEKEEEIGWRNRRINWRKEGSKECDI